MYKNIKENLKAKYNCSIKSIKATTKFTSVDCKIAIMWSILKAILKWYIFRNCN